MNIKTPTGLTNRREKFGGMQSSTASVDSIFAGGNKRDIAKRIQENQNTMLHEANERIKQQQREQRKKRRPRREGAVRLSNTDTLAMAHQIRSRLMAKLMEIHGSDMDTKSKGASAMDIKLKIDRVDRQIAAIKRRERAMLEEKTTRRGDDSPEARRRRAHDMKERRIYVRRDYLYHANNGGFDPNNPLFSKTALQDAMSSVAFDIGGNTGTMEIAANAEFETDFNMEVVL